MHIHEGRVTRMYFNFFSSPHPTCAPAFRWLAYCNCDPRYLGQVLSPDSGYDVWRFASILISHTYSSSTLVINVNAKNVTQTSPISCLKLNWNAGSPDFKTHFKIKNDITYDLAHYNTSQMSQHHSGVKWNHSWPSSCQFIDLDWKTAFVGCRFRHYFVFKAENVQTAECMLFLFLLSLLAYLVWNPKVT